MALLPLRILGLTLDVTTFSRRYLCPLFSRPRPYLSSNSLPDTEPSNSLQTFWATCISGTGLSWPGSTAVTKPRMERKTDVCLLAEG